MMTVGVGGRTAQVGVALIPRGGWGDESANSPVTSTGCEVSSLVRHGRSLRIEHSHGVTEAGHAIVCAGAWADRLAVAAGADPDPRIVPFRGAYLQLVPGRRDLVRSLIYPVPDPSLPFLGVHLTGRSTARS